MNEALVFVDNRSVKSLFLVAVNDVAKRTQIAIGTFKKSIGVTKCALEKIRRYDRSTVGDTLCECCPRKRRD